MDDTPTTWVVRARNLPEHVDNPIHTDAGARAEGFPSALVAGVTTYAYLTHPLVAAWGVDWLSRGGGEVKFRAPVFADAEVRCEPTAAADDPAIVTVAAVCPDQQRNPRATFVAVRDSGAPPAMRSGEALPSRQFTLGTEFPADYAERAGDDLAIYRDRRIAHPVTWTQIANRVFSTDLVDGAWIHTRSIIRHHALGELGTTVDVHATVVDRFERSGARAVVDIVIAHDGRPIATLEHEAIVDLTTSS